MTEAEAVERAGEKPATVRSLSEDLSALGVEPGMTLLVHSSLSSLGWVCGGAVAVVLALEDVLGDEGTLAMPTHSSDLSEPSRWRNPAVPESWWQVVRDEMPAFDVDMTPIRGVGAIPECFRKQRGTLRSHHPVESYAARGPRAEELTSDIPLDFPTGDGSFLARLYDADACVLLLGASHLCNSSFHLAEYRADYPGREVIRCGAPVLADGNRRWVEFDDVDGDDTDFLRIGEDFSQETGGVHSGRVARGTALLMRQKTLVDFAVEWMEENRR